MCSTTGENATNTISFISSGSMYVFPLHFKAWVFKQNRIHFSELNGSPVAFDRLLHFPWPMVFGMKRTTIAKCIRKAPEACRTENGDI